MARHYLILLFSLVMHVLAADVPSEWPSLQEEQRFMQLTHDYRCVVCHGQSLAESNTATARAIKDKLAIWVLEGKSNEEIRTMMIERYGENVAFRPSVNLFFVVLWTIPWLICAILFYWFYRRSGLFA